MGSRTDVDVIASSITTPSSLAAIFDRHATTMFRYFVRRVGPGDADSLLGELFRIAFERRASFDTDRAEARPWFYGFRRYEADDPEGHHWHFHESLEAIRSREQRDQD
jgi:RNA polymerase sigma-70 factor (ECF subfamily)